MKVKITQEGQPCRRCGTPVKRHEHKGTKPKPGSYYFEWFFRCPECNSSYMVEEAKRYLKSEPNKSSLNGLFEEPEEDDGLPPWD